MSPQLSADRVIDLAGRGQRASLVRGEVTQRLVQQEARIMADTLTKFRTGLLSAEQARDAIAQISALRDLSHALDKEINNAIEAREALVPSPGLPRGQRQGVAR